MKLKCPNCDVYLPTRQMNVVADVAVCNDCEETFSISRLLKEELEPEPDLIQNAGWISDSSESFDINHPPSGVSYDHHGMGWRISATTRNASAFFLVPFICVWSGFSLGGIYGSQILEGKFDLFRTLFGIPFMLGTLLFGSLAVLSVCGRVVIKSDEMDHDAGSVSLGVGPIRWTTRFRWSEIIRIEESHSSSGKNGNHSKQITLYREKSDIQFGSMLASHRLRYVLKALWQLAGTGN